MTRWLVLALFWPALAFGQCNPGVLYNGDYTQGTWDAPTNPATFPVPPYEGGPIVTSWWHGPGTGTSEVSLVVTEERPYLHIHFLTEAARAHPAEPWPPWQAVIEYGFILPGITTTPHCGLRWTGTTVPFSVWLRTNQPTVLRPVWWQWFYGQGDPPWLAGWGAEFIVGSEWRQYQFAVTYPVLAGIVPGLDDHDGIALQVRWFETTGLVLDVGPWVIAPMILTGPAAPGPLRAR